MSYTDLLERIQRNDSNAFLDLTDRYGWAVYSAIREKYPDKETAANIYNETMNSFYPFWRSGGRSSRGNFDCFCSEDFS